MRWPERIRCWFATPVLTPKRIWFAFAVAVVTDTLQLVLGPLGWVFLVDEALDGLAMVLTSAALGFHLLLLPTFIIELLPVADALPTWTACTAAVVALRKRAQGRAISTLPPSGSEKPPRLPPPLQER
jgi:hypothetical protein